MCFAQCIHPSSSFPPCSLCMMWTRRWPLLFSWICVYIYIYTHGYQSWYDSMVFIGFLWFWVCPDCPEIWGWTSTIFMPWPGRYHIDLGRVRPVAAAVGTFTMLQIDGGHIWYIVDIKHKHKKTWIITSSTAQGGGGSFKNRKPIGEVGCCESGMAERSHWWSERWLISLTISLSFSDYPPTYLPTYLSIYLSLSLSLSVCLSVCLPIYLSIYRSIVVVVVVVGCCGWCCCCCCRG